MQMGIWHWRRCIWPTFACHRCSRNDLTFFDALIRLYQDGIDVIVHGAYAIRVFDVHIRRIRIHKSNCAVSD